MERFARNFDFFNKIDESFTRITPTGGTVSLCTYIICGFMLILEFCNYMEPEIAYEYTVDKEFDKKLSINVDLVVATPCSGIGADIMDSTNKDSMYSYGQLKEKNVVFRLSDAQQDRWDEIKQYNQFMRKQHHDIHRIVWKPFELREPILNENVGLVFHEASQEKPDACRLHGTLVVNKVSGNFHISAGKYLPLPIGHAHISMIGSEKVNFSHRIEKLSFGEESYTINTLEGTEKITRSSSQLYQYYLKLVYTTIDTALDLSESYQYSVTERELEVNHEAGAHGVPGIYFKYEIDGLQVHVFQPGVPFWQFVVRLCAIIGGIFEISGLLNHLATYLVDVVTSRYVDVNIINK